MGDMQEIFQFMKEERQERHANWKEKNMDVLNKSNVPFRLTNGGEACLFRLGDRPYADFYPSTGRWRVVDNTKSRAQSGGAKKFLQWYMNSTYEG